MPTAEHPNTDHPTVDGEPSAATPPTPEITLRVYRAPSGQWSWEVRTEHGPECSAAGFPDAIEAADACVDELLEHVERYTDAPSECADPQPYERDERAYVHHVAVGAAE